MARTRREFTPECKDEAVKLVINAAVLGRWVTAFKARNTMGVLRLRKENVGVKLDLGRSPMSLGVSRCARPS